MIGREGKVRAHAQVGFGQVGLDVAECLDRIAFADQGNAAKQRDFEVSRYLRRVAQALVDLLQRDGRGQCETQADHQGQREVDRQPGRRRRLGNAGRIDDRDVARLDPGNPDLFVTLEQRLVELAVGVGLAKIDVVLDAIALLHAKSILQIGNPRAQFLLAHHRSAIVAAPNLGNTLFFAANRLVDSLDLALERTRRGIARFELDKQLGIFGRKQRPLLAQAQQCLVGQFLRRCRRPRIDLAGLCDPRRGGVGQGAVEPLKFVRNERLLTRRVALGVARRTQGDDALARRIVGNVPLGLFEPDAQPAEPFLEEAAGVGGGSEPAIDARSDELRRPGVGNLG